MIVFGLDAILSYVLVLSIIDLMRTHFSSIISKIIKLLRFRKAKKYNFRHRSPLDFGHITINKTTLKILSTGMVLDHYLRRFSWSKIRPTFINYLENSSNFRGSEKPKTIIFDIDHLLILVILLLTRQHSKYHLTNFVRVPQAR
jgi:hypothetical protein